MEDAVAWDVDVEAVCVAAPPPELLDLEVSVPDCGCRSRCPAAEAVPGVLRAVQSKCGQGRFEGGDETAPSEGLVGLVTKEEWGCKRPRVSME